MRRTQTGRSHIGEWGNPSFRQPLTKCGQAAHLRLTAVRNGGRVFQRGSAMKTPAHVVDEAVGQGLTVFCSPNDGASSEGYGGKRQARLVSG